MEVSLASVSLAGESGACRDAGVHTRGGNSGAGRKAASAPRREPLGQEDPLHEARGVLACSVTRAPERVAWPGRACRPGCRELLWPAGLTPGTEPPSLHVKQQGSEPDTRETTSNVFIPGEFLSSGPL